MVLGEFGSAGLSLTLFEMSVGKGFRQLVLAPFFQRSPP